MPLIAIGKFFEHEFADFDSKLKLQTFPPLPPSVQQSGHTVRDVFLCVRGQRAFGAEGASNKEEEEQIEQGRTEQDGEKNWKWVFDAEEEEAPPDLQQRRRLGQQHVGDVGRVVVVAVGARGGDAGQQGHHQGRPDREMDSEEEKSCKLLEIDKKEKQFGAT